MNLIDPEWEVVCQALRSGNHSGDSVRFEAQFRETTQDYYEPGYVKVLPDRVNCFPYSDTFCVTQSTEIVVSDEEICQALEEKAEKLTKLSEVIGGFAVYLKGKYMLKEKLNAE